MSTTSNWIVLTGLIGLAACGSDSGPQAVQPLQADATAAMVLGPNGRYGDGSTVVLTIRLTNPDRDTAWVNVADEATGPVGAILYDDDASTTVASEVLTLATYQPGDLPNPSIRHAIPPGESREWTSSVDIKLFGAYLSADGRANTERRYGLALELVGDTIRVPAAPFTFDAGLSRLVPETAIMLEGSGAEQTLESVTRLRNISSSEVGISYGVDVCNVEILGYRTADRSGTPDWRTDFNACGFVGYGDIVAPGELSSDPQRSASRNIATLLGALPRQRYYVSIRMNLNKVNIERPVGEVDFTPP